MSYRVGTTHYNLPQTENADKRDWFDTNEAFAEVDSVLYTALTQGADNTERIETLRSDVTALDGRVTQAESDIVDLKAGVDTANESIGTLNTNLAKQKQDFLDMICAYQEPSAVSSRQYRSGQYFIYNETLWECTADIGIGTQIVPDTNCKNTTITEIILGL